MTLWFKLKYVNLAKCTYICTHTWDSWQTALSLPCPCFHATTYRKCAPPRLAAEHAELSLLTNHFFWEAALVLAAGLVFPTSAAKCLISSRGGNAAVSYIIHSEHSISHYRIMSSKVSCARVECRTEQRYRYHPERRHNKASGFVISSLTLIFWFVLCKSLTVIQCSRYTKPLHHRSLPSSVPVPAV